jgi:hypothetical protein
MGKLIFIDPNREFNLIKLHDGEGNLYVFNIPPSLDIRMKDILIHGQLIAFKLKGESCKRIDSSSDPFYRNYLGITAMEFRDSGMEKEEFQKLLAERKKTAPVPGNETKHPPYQESVEEVTTTPLHDIDKFADIIKNATKIGKFRGQDIYRTDPHKAPFSLAEKECCSCHKIIQGKNPVSFTPDGKGFTRFQAFIPFGTAKIMEKGSHNWYCGECVGKKTAPVPSSPVAPTTLPPQKGKPYKGGAYFTFYEHEGKFFYKNNEIVKDPHTGIGHVRSIHSCAECQGEIILEASVSYKNSKPHLVSANKPINQDAVVVRPKSQHWKHIVCPKAAAPAPSPAQETPPHDHTLKEIVQSAINEGAEVRIGLSDKPRKITQSQKDHFTTLEKMAMDQSIDDKTFRGAAWMLCRTITGGSGDGDNG